ncbi:GNAT family N-acetyltransferase [Roseomonas sp. BN140053]|uniref:GNAT family N-acetyltransferase n=1 Tax=Roseomonas sp. BN140053 TaxID=3391898 RepID=UPI0039EA15B8
MSAAAAVTPVEVEVTFLRMDRPPADPAPALPEGVRVERVRRCTTAFYRFLYDTVGQDYLWWFRRTVSDTHLGAILASPQVSIHVLYNDGEPAGFYELERRSNRSTNISYFGLLPHAVGQRMGRAFLRHAVDLCWAEGAAAVTVNTCTADHPRALPNYLASGFTVYRRVREEWPVPGNLGLKLPSQPARTSPAR